MRCFEVAERAEAGLRIARFPEPHVPIRGRDPLLLDHKLAEFIKEIPRGLKGDLLLNAANLLFKGSSVRLQPEPPEWKDTRALVRVATQTVEGTIALTANCYNEEMTGSRVVKRWHPFPAVGIKTALGGPDPVIIEGGQALEILLIMEQGASFRITRTGDLQGASPEIFVQWHNDRLITRVPGRFRAMHRPYVEPTPLADRPAAKAGFAVG